MTMPGGWELIVILFIVLLLFGAKKLPGLAGSMGESIKEFRKSTRDAAEDDTESSGADRSDTGGTDAGGTDAGGERNADGSKPGSERDADS